MLSTRLDPRPADALRLTAHDRLAFLFVWLPYLALARRSWFLPDDAFISFRYARNWGSGQGLCFNPGDAAPVEGYSNFLFVAIGSVLERLGLEQVFWLPFLCACAGSLLLWLVYRCARIDLGLGRLPALLALALLGWSAPYAVWSTSGLETMPYALFFFATVERLCLRRGGAAAWSAGGLGLLLALTRVEGIAWALLVFPIFFVLARRARGESVRRPLARYGVVLVLGYGLYFAWRWSTFGQLFPATVYAKVGFSLERLVRGGDYVLTQVLSSPWLLAVVPGAFVALRRERRGPGVALALLPLGLAAYAALVGGDWMCFGRFLVPALPFVALLAAWLLADVERRVGAPAAGVAGALLVALAVLPGFDHHVVPEALRARCHFRLNTPSYRSEYGQWRYERFEGIRWLAEGRALRAFAPPGASLVVGAVGALGYASDLFLLDRFGLVTPEVGERELGNEPKLRSPGHDMGVRPTWFLEHGHEPTYLRSDLLEVGSRAELLEQLEASARRLRFLGAAERYVLDFAAVATRDDPRWFLIVWARITRGTTTEAAWAEFAARRDAFAATGEVRVLDVEPPDPARVPGLPDWL